MKFAQKIFIHIFLSTVLVIGGLSMITHFWVERAYITENIRSEKELARLVALKSQDYILRNDRIEIYQFFRSIINVDPYIEYIFAENKGEILVHTFDKGVPRGLLHLGPITPAHGVDIVPIENSQGHILYHFRVAMAAPTHAVLHFGVSDEKIRSRLTPHRNLMILVGVALLGTVPFALAFFLSRMVSRPLNVLRKGVERMGSGELSHRIDILTGDEIGQLATDVNAMAVKLEKLRDGLEEEIAERKQAQEALAKQSDLLNNILNNVPHSIFWKDCRSVYLGCNRAFADSVGLDQTDQIVGRTDDQLPWEKNRVEVRQLQDEAVMESGKPFYDIEEQLLHADGTEKTVVTSKVPLKNPDGRISGILGIYSDITERKRMEETIKQAQKMEAIGTLAGGIAHDFNNILGSIIGYTELALDDVSPDSPAQKDLKQVFKAALRAKELVRQILTFSRKSQEERKPLDLSAIVKEEAKLLRSTLPATIEIRQQIEAESCIVNAEITQMHQVVMNLCTNAAHAMQRRGGVLTISLAPLILTQPAIKNFNDLSPGPYVELKIGDTGTGIDSRVIHRIFEPFFTTKDAEKGTGMGLAVVHGIVKDHGGDIVVDSRLGDGTTFSVILPQAVSGLNYEKVDFPSLPTGNERILFVDDEKALLELGEKTLSSLGYRVTTVNGSLEALSLFQKAPDFFHLIMTDQTMPHMTGFNLAKRILSIDPSARVIICTGYSEFITAERVEEAGIRALLYKPLSRTEIARTVRDVLDR